jgi:uncharacterized protein (TIGR00251 family)
MSNVRPPVHGKKAQGTVIAVKVKPNARVSSLEKVEGGAWLARLKSPPVDGKANEELLELVARHFGSRKSAVSLTSGASARLKLVRIQGKTSVATVGLLERA